MTCLRVFCLLMLCVPSVYAAGKAKPQPGSEYTTPLPARKVVIRPVASKAFQLPNGSRVDVGADLESMFNTVVTDSSQFRPQDAAEPRPCDTHLEIRAAVTTLQLNVAEFGLKFGYTPSGEIGGVLTDIKVSTNVKVGTIALDLSLWECVAGRCASISATTVTHLTARVQMDFDLDFGAITTGPGFVYNSPLGSILRKMMVKGVQNLESSSHLNELSWSAAVREVSPESGTLIFDKGSQDRLASNQTFTVYAVTPSAGACHVYKPVAYVHTIRVDAVSSVGLVEQVLDTRAIEPGDLVMVRAAK